MNKNFLLKSALISSIFIFGTSVWSQTNTRWGDLAYTKKTAIKRAKANSSLKVAMEDYLQDAKDKNLNIQSVMVLQHGKVLYEKWLNGGEPQTPHILNSVSKTFTSAAVGLAIKYGAAATMHSVQMVLAGSISSSFLRRMPWLSIQQIYMTCRQS